MKHPKALKLQSTAMIVLIAIWIISVILVFIASLDEVWGILAFLLLIPFSAPLFVSPLAVLWSVRRLLKTADDRDTRILAVFAAAATSLFAALSYITLIARFVIEETGVEEPFDILNCGGVLSKMTFAFAGLSLFTALLGSFAGKLIEKFGNFSYALRITTIVLTVFITLAVLLIPHPAGTFNDGGSRIYEAVLYDVVDWNRTHHFDGTPFYESDQRMRIYFFPQNCYDYETQWNLRH